MGAGVQGNAGLTSSEEFRGRFWLYWPALCGLSFLQGKDLNWDLLNYHFYAPYALLNWRFNQDFLAASVQSYLNPLLDLPFFVLARSGAADWVVSSGMCAIHAVNLLLLRRIACSVLIPREGSSTGSGFWVELAVVAGGAAPLFLSQIGSSLVDVLWSIPCLAAVSLWLQSAPAHRRLKDSFLIGLLSGVAVGLKMTAGYFALGLFLTEMLMLAWTRSRRNAHVLALHVLGGVLGVALSYGWWGWVLWSYYGSPVFPFFNDVVGAPGFPHEPLLNARFQPTGVWQILRFPVDVLLADKNPYFEKSVPDVRFLLVMVLGALALMKWVKHRHEHVQGLGRLLKPGAQLLLLISIYYVIWLKGSANGRYAMPLLLLIGVALVWLCFHVFEGPRLRIYALISVMLAQGGLTAFGDDLRWHGKSAWHGKAVEVVEAANGSVLASPHTFLSLGTQTYAVTAAFAHTDSRFINLVGQKTAEPGGAQWRRLEPLLSEAGGTLRTLYGLLAERDGSGGSGSIARALVAQELLLSSYGLALDRSDCQVIAVRGAAPGGGWSASDAERTLIKSFVALEPEDAAVMSCRVLRVSAPPGSQAFPGGANAEAAFADFEQQCLGRRGSESVGMERVPFGYGKFYANSDTLVRWQLKDQSMLVWRLSRYLGRISPGNAAWPRAILDSCPAVRQRSGGPISDHQHG